jgi:hypothetical protein
MIPDLERIEEHLGYLVRVHAQDITDSVQQLHLVGSQLDAYGVCPVFLLLKFSNHCLNNFCFSLSILLCSHSRTLAITFSRCSR